MEANTITNCALIFKIQIDFNLEGIIEMFINSNIIAKSLPGDYFLVFVSSKYIKKRQIELFNFISH